MLTRKHFKDLAEAIGIEFAGEPETRARVVDLCAVFCRRANERFDRDRFERAIEAQAARTNARTVRPDGADVASISTNIALSD